MFWFILVSLVLAVIFLATIIYGYRYYVRIEKPREKREQEKIERQAEERNKQEILYYLGLNVNDVFSVELDTVHESSTQNEIVRIVNLLAHQTSVACVNQDKENRGEKAKDVYDAHEDYSSWGEAVSELKIEWSKARTLALQIAPELADRMPHFSEFEPLKSYNAKHLQQKKAKQQLQTK